MAVLFESEKKLCIKEDPSFFNKYIYTEVLILLSGFDSNYNI